jgi:hypothetical protein
MNRVFAALRRLAGRVRLPFAAEPTWARVAMLGLVLLGLAFRSRGFLWEAPPLWLDETSWAVHLVEGRYGDDNLRPLGFMAITGVLVRLFGAWESVLRALPWTAGIATTLLSPFLAQRLFNGAGARLFFVAVLALHPGAIDLAKEFKPYSVSLALHAGLLFATLRYLAQRGTRELWLVLGLGAVATLFAQDTVFAYPAVYSVLAWDAYRNHRPHLRWVLIGAATTILVLATQYVLVWSRIPEEESAYWGNKYDVFHTADTERGYLSWSFDRYRSLLDFPGLRRKYFSGSSLRLVPGFGWLELTFWWLAHGVGILWLLLRRRFAIAALLVCPCLVLWAFNALDIWPLGAFRTNLFVIVYMTGIAASAFDGSWKGVRGWATLVPAAAIVVLPFFFLQDHFHSQKQAMAYDGYMPEALKKLQTLRKHERRAAPEVLLLSSRACAQWDYYTGLHPQAEKLGHRPLQLFEPRCIEDADLPATLLEAARGRARVWVLLQGKLDTKTLERELQSEGLTLVKRVTAGWLEIGAFRRAQIKRAPLRDETGSGSTRK